MRCATTLATRRTLHAANRPPTIRHPPRSTNDKIFSRCLGLIDALPTSTRNALRTRSFEPSMERTISLPFATWNARAHSQVTPNDDEKLVETFVLPVAILIATGYSANGASDELAKGKRVCDLLAEAQCRRTGVLTPNRQQLGEDDSLAGAAALVLLAPSFSMLPPSASIVGQQVGRAIRSTHGDGPLRWSVSFSSPLTT